MTRSSGIVTEIAIFGHQPDRANSVKDPAMMSEPQDAAQRRAVAPKICYESARLPPLNLSAMQQGLKTVVSNTRVNVPARDGACFEVPAGCYFRIICPQGHQVGDLNLWHQDDLSQCFYSGKTRQLHGSHVSVGDHLWSVMPYLNPMCTIVEDSLDWYKIDEYGASVHDVIGTRCDPYTNFRLRGTHYHQCCHSNLIRALAAHRQLSFSEAQQHVHDVMNVFMCTGFTLDTHQYFMKATPARAGDQITFFAHMPLLGALSACPGGNCGSTHSDDCTPCYPLEVEILTPKERVVIDYSDALTHSYNGAHKPD